MREVKVLGLKILSNLINTSINDMINYDENILPKEVILKDKSDAERNEIKYRGLLPFRP